ncbi:MAG: hypothetical protein M1290_05630 [Candidatus Thermoplasmatota archaeon]|jgi:hypothetical protein|nr:hypothetical protein [Candidatus Thermoplasmatota archaeon]MCL5789925.1 hypothetical protein [Candidatus Thermoplasmatota archaeon]
MNKKEIDFEFERATKNTYRFQEKTTGEQSIGALYVQKVSIRVKGTQDTEDDCGVGVKEIEETLGGKE